MAQLFPAYREVCKAVIGFLSAVTGVVPFAVWDIVLVVLVLMVAVALLRRKRPLRALRRMGVVLVIAGLVFGGWALNHYAPPLASEIGLEVGEYSADELANATAYYLERAAVLAPQVPRDANGRLAEQDFYELACIGGAAYGPLAEEHAVFAGSQVPVKALLVAGEPLLLSGHTGIYVALTGEACVPLNCAREDLPFIMCHEAAHRLAIASEQEANFAAYLACSASDDARFAYSGEYNAFVYCCNALYGVDRDRVQEILAAVGQEHGEGVGLVLADWQAASEHYDAYEGPFKEVGTAVNDTYLKSFGEQSGVRSYGLVVDYLIAWHKFNRPC